jgi:predicted transposase/invertase (TIGR01784 family)
MKKHDESYRLLFSVPRMIIELLRGFFGQTWIDRIDFTSLERVNSSYVSPKLRRRETDIVWRARLKNGRPVYVYLLLELQSSVQKHMAVRLMAYVALLYQDLIKRGELSPNGKLPLVIPIVLYNGEERWWAPLQLADLIEEVDPEADLFRPRFAYKLIDEGSYALDDLAARKNLAAALFWPEKTPAPEDLRQGIDRLVKWLGRPEDGELRSAFAVWLQTVRFSGEGMPEEEVPDTLGLEEFRTMLAKRVEEWNEKLLERGRQEGRQEGEREGRREGLQEGLQKGRREGEAGLVLSLLEQKFGPLDARNRKRVMSADEARLLAWAKKTLVAVRIADVFSE